MEATHISIILALIAIVPGSVALFRGWRKDRAEAKKAEAEAAGTHVMASMELVDRMEVRMDKMDITIASQNENIVILQSEVQKLKDEREILLEGMEMLCGQLVDAGLDPVWKPVLDDEGRIVG